MLPYRSFSLSDRIRFSTPSSIEMRCGALQALPRRPLPSWHSVVLSNHAPHRPGMSPGASHSLADEVRFRPRQTRPAHAPLQDVAHTQPRHFFSSFSPHGRTDGLDLPACKPAPAPSPGRLSVLETLAAMVRFPQARPASRRPRWIIWRRGRISVVWEGVGVILCVNEANGREKSLPT